MNQFNSIPSILTPSSLTDTQSLRRPVPPAPDRMATRWGLIHYLVELVGRVVSASPDYQHVPCGLQNGCIYMLVLCLINSRDRDFEIATSTFLVALVFISRAQGRVEVTQDGYACERIILSAVMLAQKVVDDVQWPMSEWELRSAYMFSKKDIRRMELDFLSLIGWDVSYTRAELRYHEQQLFRLQSGYWTSDLSSTASLRRDTARRTIERPGVRSSRRLQSPLFTPYPSHSTRRTESGRVCKSQAVRGGNRSRSDPVNGPRTLAPLRRRPNVNAQTLPSIRQALPEHFPYPSPPPFVPQSTPNTYVLQSPRIPRSDHSQREIIVY
ncbi:hypothetical protein CERSUDRAFT_91739 [Gelatoporia subvermispora B]|uniref:Cyclin N-terminal domain-containing protein n=1 Tax=Ceriporiopsis subvermispora (strain B) TaxID=914234 RepID=M2QV70_CERS8|nr:hypothetical protein CERSUDRAFT_91739 [Gelatoporia subvermispora B]